MIEIKNAASIAQPWTRWFFIGDTGCIAGDQKVRFQVRHPVTGKKQDSKGGTMERLFYRFNRIKPKGKGRFLREETNESLFFVPCMDEDQRIFQAEIEAVLCSGVKPCVRVRTMGGRSVVCTADHPFATADRGYVPVEKLGVGAQVLVHTGRAWTTGKDREVKARRPEVFVKHHPYAPTKTVTSESSRSGEYTYKRLANARFVYEAKLNRLSTEQYKQRLNDGALAGLEFLPVGYDVHHLDENPMNDDPDNLVAVSHADHARGHYNEPGNKNLKYLAEEDEIISIEPVGEQMTYDIRMKRSPHSFIVEDFVVHNSGKTSCALTFPYPFFVIPSTENSIVTGRGQDIPYVETTGPDDFGKVILPYLEDAQRKSQEFLRTEKYDEAWAAFPYQTVVVESLSHYTDLIIEELTDGGKKKMDMQQWGILSGHLRNIHSRLSNLPVHVVYTALAEVKESENGPAAGSALMSGAMKTKLPSACDAIGYCEQTPGKATKENPMPGMNFRVHFQRYKQFAARIRAPRDVVTPPYVDDFHFDKVKGLFGIE